MQKFLSILIITLILSFGSKAQVSKIGYTNIDYVLSLMPEMKGLQNEIQDYGTQLKNSLEKKSQAFQLEVTQFQQAADKMNEVERNSKQRELAGTQENLVKMQQDSELSLQKKQVELIEPLYKKIQARIEEVRKEKGYDIILNESVNGISVIISADNKYDVTDDVLKKLGITPPPREN